MEMFRVFVYGTLKRREPNHHWLTNESNGIAKFVSTGQTTQSYPLIIATKYNIPFLLDCPGKGYEVHGEVYDVDEKMLKNLDELEDHPTFYTRFKQPIKMGDKCEKMWIYFLQNFKADLLTKDMYESYSNEGPHGLKYTERYLREHSYSPKKTVKDI